MTNASRVPVRRAAVIPTPSSLANRLANELAWGGNEVAVLDPACGTGNLLLAALNAAQVFGLDRLRIHGLEIDRRLADRCAERLDAVVRSFQRRSPLRVEVDVRCADALAPSTAWPSACQILANPPWLSLSGRQRAFLGAGRSASLRRSFASLRGWPSLHAAFLERIASYVEEHGTRALVLAPASLCELAGYAPARAEIERHARLAAEPLQLGESAFPGVVAPAVVLELVPSAASGADDRIRWSSRPSDALVEHLARFPRLPATSFADPGVHTGNAAHLLVRRASPSEARRLGPNLREGRDLRPFDLSQPAAWLRTDLSHDDGLRFRIAPWERYRSYPVLLRQTANRPMAALHVEPTYFRNSLLACAPPPELDPAFVVAILNGPVARAFHRASFADARQRAFPQVKVAHLRSQPFPITHRDQDPGLHDELAARARALQAGGDDGPWSAARLEQLALAAFGLAPTAIEIVKELA